jgi:hypothetical protein
MVSTLLETVIFSDRVNSGAPWWSYSVIGVDLINLIDWMEFISRIRPSVDRWYVHYAHGRAYCSLSNEFSRVELTGAALVRTEH